MMTTCKECDAATDDDDLIKAGWEYIRLVEDEDDDRGMNGWRCPTCAAGYEAMAERDIAGKTEH